MAVPKPKLDPFLLPSPPPSPKSRKRRLPRGLPLHRRRDSTCLFLLPLLCFCGVMMCVGPFSSLLASRRPFPGSVYRSHVVFDRMWPHLVNSSSSSSVQLQTLWTYKRRLKEQKPCLNPSDDWPFAGDSEANQTTGYLLVEANGGLNQQRSAICNAVAVAAILNAILVIPQFEFNEVWKDPSKFEDIYNEDHFISTLHGYVKVVRQLPQSLMERYAGDETSMPNLRILAWATVKYYLSEVYPVLRTHGVIRLAPFANRLSMNVPPQVQFLRCLTNFKALRFSSSILALADRLTGRMKERSSSTGGKYISIHLRFEEDMVAFSCCLYDGGEAERIELEAIRQRGWRGKFNRKDRTIDPGLNRIDGKCPMTPLEVGMMLRGMGFDNRTSIYLASGKVYHADRYLAPLLKMFPFIYTKDSLATPDELSPFEGYSSRLAALDYMVCLQSEAFVTTQGGNFPHFLMGQRRFLFDGHSKTIKPNKQKLALLLQDGVRWTEFKTQMETMLRENDHKAGVIPRVKKFNRKTSIYAFPFPECRCLLHSSRNSSSRPAPNLDGLDYSHFSSNR